MDSRLNAGIRPEVRSLQTVLPLAGQHGSRESVSCGQPGNYPVFRYMGSKHRLLPWIHEVLRTLEFQTALDPFSGTGCVSYLLKCMGKCVTSSDFLHFPTIFAKATIENSRHRLDDSSIEQLLSVQNDTADFIARTFTGVFYTNEDLRFLDQVSANIRSMENPYHQALAMSALLRACLKRQPRGVFTVSGDLGRYDDGRRDLRLSIRQHFLEQIEVFNQIVFDNGQSNQTYQADVFETDTANADLVYLDPPYVPRSDDNCYIKRYHFLEGLSCYWKDMGIDYSTKVRKIAKRFTPFSYRRTALEAFDSMFAHFKNSIIVLSYSSNGYPDLEHLEQLLRKHKNYVKTYEKAHRYHFGTHSAVGRAEVTEYLIVGI